MAKKSKRPPARRQQRPPQRPQSLPLAGLSTSTAPDAAPPDVDGEEADDYAATAIPLTESDGPMPLPPAEEEAFAPAATTRTPVAAGATVSERRRVGRIDPAQAAARQTARAKSGRQQSTAAMFEPLPPDDDAIPFDRVPYVPGDLRRVLAIALLMVVLVVVADIVINNVVK
ncbi:MAG TPA: hypothetical protein VFC09_10100 [Candidatus Dormibacteraeota bacterium]|nr:hypothetical protein [Candidatus Dormibacteraeota bacterium]